MSEKPMVELGRGQIILVEIKSDMTGDSLRIDIRPGFGDRLIGPLSVPTGRGLLCWIPDEEGEGLIIDAELGHKKLGQGEKP